MTPFRLKTIDKKLADLGFAKTEENDTHVRYARPGSFNHVVEILHKASGHHILQSYDPDLFDEKHIGNCCVGLTYKELRLFSKKMRQLSWN